MNMWKAILKSVHTRESKSPDKITHTPNMSLYAAFQL